MLRRNVVLYTLVSLGVYGCGSGTNTVYVSDCSAPEFNTQIAEQLLTSWGQGLQTYNAANKPDIYVSAGDFTMTFYAPYAILQPTKSPVQREGTQAIYNYFTSFLASNPVMTFNPESNVAASLGCGFGSYVGYYDFVTDPGTPQESAVEARFTFLYEYKGSVFSESFVAESGPTVGQTYTQTNQPGWYILVQQSSALPITH